MIDFIVINWFWIVLAAVSALAFVAVYAACVVADDEE